METQVWLDTTVYDDDYEDCFNDEKEYANDELEKFISRYAKRYHTYVENMLLIAKRESFYGDWNPAAGRTGYRLVKNLDEILKTSSDYIKIYVGDDELIHIDFFDHDGVDHSVVKLIPGSIDDAVYNEYGCDACELDYVEMLKKRGNLKPTKFWQAK